MENFKQNEQTANAETEATENAEKVSVETEQVSVATASDDLNNYFVTTFKGEDIAYGSSFALNQNEYFTVQVDYLGLINHYRYDINDIKSCILCIWGRSRMLHSEYAVYSLLTNELIGEFSATHNLYYVNLKNLYDAYGDASFRFVAKWEGEETVALDALDISRISDMPNFIHGDNTNDQHYAKSFNLTNNVVLQADLAEHSSYVAFCDVPTGKTLVDMDIQHIFIPGMQNVGYGQGFNLNICEKIVVQNNIVMLKDAMGNYYHSNNDIIKGMKYTTSAPSSVQELDIYDYLKNEYTGADKGKLLPVKWLYNACLAKGYNADGYLVLVNDNNKNHFQLKYNVNNKIAEFRNMKDDFVTSTLTFSYFANGDLKRILLSNDDYIDFEYTDQNLTKIKYSYGKSLTLEYDGKFISKIISSDGTYVNLDMSSSGVTAKIFSALTGIPNGTECDYPPELESYTVIFGENKATVNNQEVYNFTSGGTLKSYYKIKNLKVINAEQYDFITYLEDENYLYRQEIYKAKPSILNKSSLSDFVFEYGEYAKAYYNHYGQIAREELFNVLVSDNSYCDVTTTYEYDDNNMCVKTNKDVTFKLPQQNKSYTEITEYAYDNNLNLCKKTTYVSSEVETLGKNIEEYSYNSRGENILTISYNSLEPDKKFYDERTYDELGRLLTQIDQIGTRSVTYGYVNDTDILSSITYGDGSFTKFRYDGQGNIVAVSTGDGDGNLIENTIEYTDGKVTKLCGGNDDISFSYNAKRQINDITLGANTWITFARRSDLIKYTAFTNAKNEDFLLRTVKEDEHMQYEYNEMLQFEEKYDFSGKIIYQNDAVTNKEYQYSYDELDRLTTVSMGDAAIENYMYNEYGELSEINLNGDLSQTVTYHYEDNSLRRLNKIEFSDSFKEEFSYDL